MDFAVLTESDFRRLADFIEGELGIRMPDSKRVMLESRLQKRRKIHGFDSFRNYIDFAFSSEGRRSELVNMIDAVTTNKTDFFREADHFEYLKETIIPTAAARDGTGLTRPFTVWSAGCSTGEEPYTIAMVLEEKRRTEPRFNYRVLASDLSSQVLERARTAVYDESKTEVVPLSLKKRYMLKSKKLGTGLVRMKPEIRAKVSFERINFMDDNYPVQNAIDVVFCRNVIIYFERRIQESILGKLSEHIRVGGWLILGHSETVIGMGMPLRGIAPTIYEKTGEM